MRMVNAFLIAFSTYSRIPMPQADWTEENRRYAFCFFPLVGAVVGLALFLWLRLSAALGFGGLLRGGFGACIPLLVTGGIHMDGFMDTCDALASHQPRERRLEILKDSRVGAFAVMGCAGCLLLTAGLLAEVAPAQAPAAAMIFVASRAMSALTSVRLKSARPGGMLDGFAKTAAGRAVTLCAWACLAACAAVWLAAGTGTLLLCAGGVLLALAVYARMAYRCFGGVTGDLAGWYLQVTETLCLAALVLGGRMQ